MSWKLGKTYYTSRLQIFNLADLESDQVQEEMARHGYHLYLICKRKKMHFVKCDTTNPEFNTSEFYYLNQNHDKIFFNKAHSKDLTIKTFNNNFYYGYSPNGDFEMRDFVFHNAIYDLPGDEFGSSEPGSLPTDLEIMYIGQSYGGKQRNEPKKIDSRVGHHEKVQAIAIEILNESSDNEILIIGACIEARQLGTLTLDTNNFNPNDLTIEMLTNLNENAKVTLSKDQEVTLCEASLIKLFQTRFNREYKSTFPGMGYSSYSEIYTTDFNYVSMAIDTKVLSVRVYSADLPTPRYTHLGSYALKSDDQKKEFFDYLFEDFKNQQDINDETFNLALLLDERNAALWKLLNENFTIDLQVSDEPNYRCYTTDTTSTIYVLPDNLCKDAFTHELLHVYLRFKGLMIGNKFNALIAGSKVLQRLFSPELLEHIGNCLDHIKMYSIYEDMGFDPEKFLTDYNTFKLKSSELSGLKKYYKEQGQYNSRSVDIFIGKFIAVFADFNMNFDYDTQLNELRKIDPVLYDLLDKFLIEWEDLDPAAENIQACIDNILNTLYQDLKRWITGKTFVSPAG